MFQLRRSLVRRSRMKKSYSNGADSARICCAISGSFFAAIARARLRLRAMARKRVFHAGARMTMLRWWRATSQRRRFIRSAKMAPATEDDPFLERPQIGFGRGEGVLLHR